MTFGVSVHGNCAATFVLEGLFLGFILYVSPCTLTCAEASPQPTVVAQYLLREAIAGAADKEVIVSRVSFPPNTELPWHWHPGEEVFYVMSGAVTLKRRGLPDVAAQAGDAHSIAPKIIHTGLTADEGVELVIFRIHTVGEPERYLAD
jgi:quercetin dioxygenase-like cupin family protein